jgi:hypothetical protein
MKFVARVVQSGRASRAARAPTKKHRVPQVLCCECLQQMVATRTLLDANGSCRGGHRQILCSVRTSCAHSGLSPAYSVCSNAGWASHVVETPVPRGCEPGVAACIQGLGCPALVHSAPNSPWNSPWNSPAASVFGTELPRSRESFVV